MRVFSQNNNCQLKNKKKHKTKQKGGRASLLGLAKSMLLLGSAIKMINAELCISCATEKQGNNIM